MMNVIIVSGDNVCWHSHTVTISDKAQIGHLCDVLKVVVGDTIKIAQLNGRLGYGKIAKISPKQIDVSDVVLDKLPPKKLGVSVVLALPRPKVLRRLIMDMTAIGVNQIILINSYRTDKSYWQSPLMARLDEFVLEGLQQGVDSVPPNIILAKRFKPFVEDSLANFGKKIVVAHPYADDGFDAVCADRLPDVLVIGAEGGWIDYEIALLRENGATIASLGERILRTESAVNALLGRWLA